MEHTVSVAVSARIAVPRAALFDWFIPVELPRVLLGYGPVPRVVATSDQTGPWDRPGSSRTVHLSDGTTAREQVTECSRPADFAYRVGDFTNAIGRLAPEARGRWSFTEAGERATDVRWTYTFVGRSALARLALAPVVQILWRGFMRVGLKRMTALAEAEAPSRG
jgi:hypothetical protein